MGDSGAGLAPPVTSQSLRQVWVNNRNLEDDSVCLPDLHKLLAEEGL